MKFLSSLIASFFFFSIALPSAQAFYSPILANDKSNIQQHLTLAKQRHGVGSAYDIMKRFQQNRKEANEKSLVTYFAQSLAQYIFENLSNAGSDLLLTIRFWPWSGTFITTCLRDDLWEIQVLQEQILNELFKAAFMGDFELATLLWDDFDLLDKRIKGGKLVRNGKEEPVIALRESYSSSYWFPTGPQFYLNCPYGEYEQALQRLGESFKRMQSIGSAITPGSLKSIPKIARQRGVRRARQWIAANQMTLSLGGPQGGNPSSLLRGAGFAGFRADFLQQWNYLKNIGDQVFIKAIEAFREQNKNAVSLDAYADAYLMAEKEKKLVQQQGLQALQYQLSLSSISEQSLVQIDGLMTQTNTNIKGLYDKAYTKEANAKSLCELMKKLVQNQCTNKTPNLPEC